jgi:hypothetical protein
MPIDGIGKPPGVPPPGSASGASGPGAASRPGGSSGESFRVGASAPEGVAGGDLDRLERGDLTLDAYLDARVGAATQHLEGRLGRAELDFVKQSLRSAIESDPVLVELVRRATGRSPGTSEA